MPPCRLRRSKCWKLDYETVHSEVYLNKYVVSIAPFSTPAFTPTPFTKLLFFACFRLLIFHPFSRGVSWLHLPLCADTHGPVCCRRYIIPVFRLCLPPDRAPRGRRPFGVRPFSWTTDSLSSLSPTHNNAPRDDMLPPPMAVRLAADLRPSADGSAVRTWLSYRQPACL